jgi:hypothetical protein
MEDVGGGEKGIIVGTENSSFKDGQSVNFMFKLDGGKAAKTCRSSGKPISAGPTSRRSTGGMLIGSREELIESCTGNFSSQESRA